MTPKAGDQHYGVNSSFRAERLKQFLVLVDEVVREKGACRILDVGGNRDYWIDLEPLWKDKPVSITTINLEPERIEDDRFTSLQGDCRSMPWLEDNSFDIVHSNSLLEHVGRWADMSAVAGEIRRLAPRYFVQTPNYWFPLEPHFKTPFFHWLPEPVRLNLVLSRGLGAFPKATSIDVAQSYIEDSNLLDAKRFMHLFPDGELRRERVYGLTKSLIAVR